MAELLSTAEAAKVLDVTPGTLMVWRSVKRYPLRYIRVGRKIRYRQTESRAGRHFIDNCHGPLSGVPEHYWHGPESDSPHFGSTSVRRR